MPDPYATVEQLTGSEEVTGWLPAGTVVADADRLLRRASELVDEAVRVPFAVDEDGLPTDTDKAQALADATCAQVEDWLEVGEENDVDGLAGTQLTVTGFNGRRPPRYGPRMLRVLRNNGLISASQEGNLAARFFLTQTGS